jgi:uncharacterized protein YdeI (YjbR/CyaY-like superfamily)
MDKSQLATLISQYRTGLEAEIAILHRLQETAARQREASAAHDLAALNRWTDERDSLMTSLVNVESQLRDTRKILSERKKEIRLLEGYREALELHQEAMGLVSQILATDAESTEALAKAELARRDTARALEQGETTLSAYRRVMTTPAGGALVDRRG